MRACVFWKNTCGYHFVNIKMFIVKHDEICVWSLTLIIRIAWISAISDGWTFYLYGDVEFDFEIIWLTNCFSIPNRLQSITWSWISEAFDYLNICRYPIDYQSINTLSYLSIDYLNCVIICNLLPKRSLPIGLYYYKFDMNSDHRILWLSKKLSRYQMAY